MMKQIRILVVEDEDSIREAERLYLEREGYEVVEAADGDVALTQFAQGGVDLVLLDLNLPKKDGLEVCKTIRATDPLVPILMVTARVEELDELKGLTLGADDYLKKPFSPKILVARVHSLLRRHSPQSILTFSDLEIDPTKQAVTIHGRAVPLTTIPFKILYLLASHPERVFSRDEILDRVYGEDAVNVFDRVIDAHIRLVRQALGKGVEVIHTVVGSGYKFSLT